MARSTKASRRGLWFILGAATLWGTTGVATQTIYHLGSTNPLSVSFLRLSIAAFVLLLLCWRLLGRRMWQVKRRDLPLLLCMGALQAVFQFSYFAAIPQCGVTIATLIAICVAPLIVVLLAALFLKERVTPNILLALLCALVGTALLTGTTTVKGGSGSLLLGVLLSLVSATGYAFLILLGRSLSGRYHALQINAAAFGSGAIILFACSLATHLVLSYPVESWLILLYLGVIPTALAYVLFQAGMRSTPATLTSLLTFSEPLTAAVLAWLLFGERLTLLGMLGALLLLGTLGLLARRSPI